MDAVERHDRQGCHCADAHVPAFDFGREVPAGCASVRRRNPALAETADPESLRGARLMDWHQIQSSWDKYVAAAKSQWVKLSEEQLKATKGRYDILSARVQEAYGLSSRQADFQISEWQSRQAAR
ncbi:MAG TPA: hypothetical protein VKP89_20010 [Burkholderiales bacterium]|nr:hypothetical protein [Burkholderiales bacterium]